MARPVGHVTASTGCRPVHRSPQCTMLVVRAVAFAGSLRADSWNRKLLRLAIEAALGAGLHVTELGLAGIPLYDGDEEARGFPPAVAALRESIRDAAALIIATPEYNHSIPGVLKNAIDWASRPPNAFDGRIAAIVGASTGPLGTVHAQHALRPVLAAVNVLVLPAPRITIARAPLAFEPDGSLKDTQVAGQLQALMRRLADTTRALANGGRVVAASRA
jgi:chromate reductase